MDGVWIGTAVGVSDLMFVYPLAVLATRREAGMSLVDAIKVGRYWSGAMTQTILIPYSIMVEFGTKFVKRSLDASPIGAAVAVTGIVSMGLQPIEKKLVVEQLLQSRKMPMLEYARIHSVQHLYTGFTPLAMREFIYIASISVINPWIVQRFEQNGFLAAFSVGFSAGMLSAPCQTINAMMKDENNKHKSLRTLIQNDVFNQGPQRAIQRLFFGAATRSCRCGGAGLLYYFWRTIFESNSELDKP